MYGQKVNDTMKANKLSSNLFPGLRFCDPVTDRMVQAAEAWVAFCGVAGPPLPAGPHWGTGTVVPSAAIVFHRHLPNDVREEFHWSDGQCTAHGFTVHVRNVRVVVSIEGDRKDELELAENVSFYVKGWLGIPAVSFDDDDEAAYAADDHDPNDEGEGDGGEGEL